MRIFIFIFFLSLFLGTLLAQEPVKDIYWDKDKGVLSYNIPKDSLVKIRVGSEKGPVYRTLVNLEERKAGKTQELWDSKDESGLIDFKDYGPLHFCIDTLPNSKKDLALLVDAQKSDTFILNVNETDKAWFCREGALEIMTFLDNRLIKLAKANSLPYILNLDSKVFSPSKHLLSLNVWSKDHSSVAYKSFLVHSQKEYLRPSALHPRKSAFTGKIAYCQRDKGFWQVEIANSDGSKPQALTKSPVDKRYPSWSPDGKKIAYVTNDGQLWIMNNDGSNNHKIQLSLHASCPRWSPDGKRIIFVSYQDLYHGDSEIWEVDLETAKLKKLISRPWLQYDPCYSPDGANFLFTDGPELYAQDIRKLNLKNGDVTQLTDNGAFPYDMQPAYSPDGERIVYSSNESGNYDIWIMDKFGQDKRNLTQSPSHDIMPQISIDAKKIFFLSDRTGNLEVWQRDIEGNNLSQITKTGQDKQDLSIYTVLNE